MRPVYLTCSSPNATNYLCAAVTSVLYCSIGSSMGWVIAHHGFCLGVLPRRHRTLPLQRNLADARREIIKKKCAKTQPTMVAVALGESVLIGMKPLL